MLEYILVAEVTIITGLLCGGVVLAYRAIQMVKGTVGPIIGFINHFGK
jgi:hypothetical protein